MMEVKKISICWIIILLIINVPGICGLTINPQITNPVYDNYNFKNGPANSGCIDKKSIDIQIVPGSCSPTIISSDLLEEQNVPVFCKLSSVQPNPLVDISKIKSIHFKGDYPSGVSGVSYFPSKAKIVNENNIPDILNSPVNNDLGYIAIVVSKYSSDGDMPSFIEGKITATIDYEIESDSGVGETNFYLNEMDDSMWKENYMYGGFWNGKGYIRVDSIKSDTATISIYGGVDSKHSSVTLKSGETSKEIYFGEDSCSGGMKIRLGKIGIPEDSALIKINNEETWVSRGDTLLDGKCKIRALETFEIGGKLSIDCSSNGGKFDLSLNPSDALSDKDFYVEGISNKDKLAKGYYDEAIKKYEELFEFYSNEKDSENNIYAAVGLFEAAQLSKQVGMIIKSMGFYNKLIQEYPESYSAQEAIKNKELLMQYDFKNSKKIIELEGNKISIDLLDFKKPATNLKKQALVKIIPVNYETRTETSFIFRVNIEKRSFKLSPELARGMADNLMEMSNKLKDVNEKLGKVIGIMKTACFVTSNLLTSKNKAGSLSGESIARGNLMTSSSGWNEECERLVNNGKYSSLQQCLIDHNENIEGDVKLYGNEIERTNKLLKEAGVGSNTDSKVIESNFKNKFDDWCKNQDGSITLTDKENTKIPFKGEMGVCNLKDLTHEQRKDIMTLTNVKTSGSDTLKKVVDKKLENIILTNKNKADFNKLGTEETKKEKYNNSIKNLGELKVKYFEKEPYRGLPSEIPFDIKNGWYVEVTYVSSGFGKISDNSNRIINYYICNAGVNGLIEFKKGGDDVCRYYDEKADTNLDFPGMGASESRALVSKAKKAMVDASKQYGKEMVTINGETFNKGVSFGGESGKCTDSFSAEDCKLLFNVCDPVICPSSRCDFGGKYHVDSVIQTGVVGSLLLCLPNMNEGVVVPICLTGVHAGLEGYVSVLDSTIDCLEESIDTGRNVGICDEIKSVYICELFFKQASPFLGELFPELGGAFSGEGFNSIRGGGEYVSMDNAWENTQGALDYFKEDYTLNSMQAFQSRSISEIGTGLCGSFVSQSVGGGINEGFSSMGSNSFLGDLMEPDSPVQFHAWFSETPDSGSTSSTSHYKVYFHIYAGRESSVSYNVYLKDSQGSGSSYSVESGQVPLGSQVDRTKDFTAPPGFKQLCVNVNGQEECGFGKVSTSYMVNSLTESYTQDQIEQKITSEKECMSNSNGAVTRICSTENPGKQTDMGVNQWEEVGYCGDSKLKCWLDTKSVKSVIKNNGEEVSESNLNNLLKEVDYMTNPESLNLANKIEDSLSGLTIKGETREVIEKEISVIIVDLDTLTTTGSNNLYRAKGLYLYGKLYNQIALSILNVKGPIRENIITEGSEDLILEEENTGGIWKDEILKEDVRIVVKRGFVEISYRFKENRWISKDEDFVNKNLDYVEGIKKLVEGTDFWHEIRIYLTKDYVAVKNNLADSDEEMAEKIFEVLRI